MCFRLCIWALTGGYVQGCSGKLLAKFISQGLTPSTVSQWCFSILRELSNGLLQNSVAPIVSIMIIDGRRYQCSMCDIGSSFTNFHPACLWRHPASLSISVDCDWLEGMLVLLPFSQAPFLAACLQASFWNWLMDWLCEWQDQCSRTTSARDRPRSHMTPVYVPVCASEQHHSWLSALQ